MTTTATATRTWTLSIPAPAKMLSANTRLPWRALRPISKAWREAAYLYARQAKLPTGLGLVRVEIELHHTVNRARDNANWHPYVGKPIVDGLTSQRTVQQKSGAARVEVGYGLVPDDTPAHLDGPHIEVGEKVSRKEFPLGLAVVTIVDLDGPRTGGFETERREMRRTTEWTFRCPARHQVSVTVRGLEDPGLYRDVFMGEHAACEVAS